MIVSKKYLIPARDNFRREISYMKDFCCQTSLSARSEEKSYNFNLYLHLVRVKLFGDFISSGVFMERFLFLWAAFANSRRFRHPAIEVFWKQHYLKKIEGNRWSSESIYLLILFYPILPWNISTRKSNDSLVWSQMKGKVLTIVGTRNIFLESEVTNEMEWW